MTVTNVGVRPGFALWLTGLPACGKSSIASAVHACLAERGIGVDILESDEARKVITPAPTYLPNERELFYRALVYCGVRLVAHDVNVIFDATANRRIYRRLARDALERLSKTFVEVFVECPLNVCQARDTKGTYEKAATGRSATVPGVGEPYEEPLAPELRLDSVLLSPDRAADRIVRFLEERRLIEKRA